MVISASASAAASYTVTAWTVAVTAALMLSSWMSYKDLDSVQYRRACEKDGTLILSL